MNPLPARISWRILPWLLLAAGLLSFAVVGTVHGGRKAEIARAAAALQDLHRFLSGRASDQGLRFPATLSDLPGWEQHVDGLADPKLQALCRKITYACDSGSVPEGARLATIELDRMRVVLLQGGAVFAEPILGRAKLPPAQRDAMPATPETP